MYYLKSILASYVDSLVKYDYVQRFLYRLGKDINAKIKYNEEGFLFFLVYSRQSLKRWAEIKVNNFKIFR